MEKKEIKIEGITCMGCVSTLEKAFYSSGRITQVAITQATGETMLEGESLPSDAEIEQLVSNAGYAVSNASKKTPSAFSVWLSQYQPLLLIAAYLLVVTLAIELSSGIFLWETWMPNFMAGFFLVFSFFKLLDLSGFANAYKSYDIIAKLWKPYGYIYPFIEVGLGLAYLLFPDSSWTHLITAIIMFVSLIGVVRSVLKKDEIKCACLGTVFNLPMSTVTIIEDGIMLLMAVLMYLNTIG
jgi:cation transport ATPase